MSLPDYYSILHVSVTATHTEIKAAYRRLAKIYHPDKNIDPSSEEKFKLIKEAYETLIHTHSRRKYDEKRNRALTFSHQTNLQKKPQPKKKYDITEQDLKRRQYYQQHYKKNTTQTFSKPQEKKQKSDRREIKYILLSVPVAVALMLLVIRLYEKPKEQVEKTVIPIAIDKRVSELRTTDSPYTSALGKNKYDSTSHAVVKVENRSGYDAIIFLRDTNDKVIRHHFIENGYRIYLENIPQNIYRLYYWLGKYFSTKKILFDDVAGNFSDNVRIDSFPEKINLKNTGRDTLVFSISGASKKANDTLLLKKIFGR